MNYYHLPPKEFAALRDKDCASEKTYQFSVNLTDLEHRKMEQLAKRWNMTPDQFLEVFLADITHQFRSSGGDESMLARWWYQRHGAYDDREELDS